MSNATSTIFARRVSRIAFGLALTSGALYLWLGAAGHPFNLWGRRCCTDSTSLDGRTTVITTWIVAFTLAVIVRFVARIVTSRLRISGDPQRLLAESLILPAVGIALLLPISLHMLMFLRSATSYGFDDWVSISLRITGPAHLVFALSSALRGHQLAAGKPAWSPRSIYLLTVFTSCIPFAMLFGIPPVLVAITALPILPLLGAMATIVTRERDALAEAPESLPRARLVR